MNARIKQVVALVFTSQFIIHKSILIYILFISHPISSSANQSFVLVRLNVLSKVKSPKSNSSSLPSHTDSPFHCSSEHLSRLRIRFIWILHFLYDPSYKSSLSEAVSPQWMWCTCILLPRPWNTFDTPYSVLSASQNQPLFHWSYAAIPHQPSLNSTFPLSFSLSKPPAASYSLQHQVYRPLSWYLIYLIYHLLWNTYPQASNSNMIKAWLTLKELGFSVTIIVPLSHRSFVLFTLISWVIDLFHG